MRDLIYTIENRRPKLYNHERWEIKNAVKLIILRKKKKMKVFFLLMIVFFEAKENESWQRFFFWSMAKKVKKFIYNCSFFFWSSIYNCSV